MLQANIVRRHFQPFPTPVRWLAVALLCGGLGGSGAVAAGEAPGFTVRAWQTRDGLPQNTINAVTRTRDGYLWLGTQNGLVRFDGVRFKVFGLRDDLDSVRITALHETADGRLWVGTAGGGLSQWSGGRFQTLGPHDGLAGDQVTALAEDAQTNLWIGTTEGLNRLRGNQLTKLGAAAGLPGRGIRALFVDSSGTLWVSTQNEGVFQLRGGRFVEVPLAYRNPTQKIAYCFLEDRQRRIWVSIGNGTLLCQDHGTWQTCDETSGLPFAYVACLAETRDGTIWAGSLDAGLFFWQQGRFHPVTRQDGLSGDAIRSLLADPSGDLWVGTRASGLNRLAPQQILTLATPEGLTNEFVRSIAESADGHLWVAVTGGGLYRETNGQFAVFNPGPPVDEYRFIESVLVARDGTLWWAGSQGVFRFTARDGLASYIGQQEPWLRGNSVLCLCEGRDGVMRLGTSRGQLREYRNGRFEIVTNMPAAEPILALAEGPAGDWWAGTENTGVMHLTGTNVTVLNARSGLGCNATRTLHFDATGALWIGTAGGGLVRWQDGRLDRFTSKDGLPDDTISQILEDEAGDLWLGSTHGIFRVRRQELDARARGSTAYLHPLLIGPAEGMLAEECSSGSNPACLRSRQGRLYFSTVQGVAVVDPGRLKDTAPPPTVVIEEVVLNGETVLTGGVNASGAAPDITVPPGAHNVEFHYTGLNCPAPGAIQFRFRLEGLDPDWVEAGTRRVAYYPQLRPGRYRFRVLACNSDGVWSPDAAVVNLVLEPHFYQAGWFALLTAVAAGGALALVVRFVAQRNLRRQVERLETQHAVERERARIAKDIHDDLGASLTQITLVSELGRSEAGDRLLAEQHFSKIGRLTRLVVQALDEIVWAVNPRNDTLARLASYLCRFADECFESSPIRCWQKVPAELPALPVRAELRHNFFLAVKEALHNVLKHSRATEVWLRLRLDGRTLRLTVEDNGQGFEVQSADFTRSGLKNMRTRMEEIGGSMHLDSLPQHGTRVEFMVELDAPPADPAAGTSMP